jgi:hypothetical protein
MIGIRSAEFTLVDYPLMDGKEIISLKNNDRLKQEMKYKIDFLRISYTISTTLMVPILK